jgi:hypothetical protein
MWSVGAIGLARLSTPPGTRSLASPIAPTDHIDVEDTSKPPSNYTSNTATSLVESGKRNPASMDLDPLEC